MIFEHIVQSKIKAFGDQYHINLIFADRHFLNCPTVFSSFSGFSQFFPIKPDSYLGPNSWIKMSILKTQNRAEQCEEAMSRRRSMLTLLNSIEFQPSTFEFVDTTISLKISRIFTFFPMKTKLINWTKTVSQRWINFLQFIILFKTVY